MTELFATNNGRCSDGLCGKHAVVGDHVIVNEVNINYLGAVRPSMTVLKESCGESGYCRIDLIPSMEYGRIDNTSILL